MLRQFSSRLDHGSTENGFRLIRKSALVSLFWILLIKPIIAQLQNLPSSKRLSTHLLFCLLAAPRLHFLSSGGNTITFCLLAAARVHSTVFWRQHDYIPVFWRQHDYILPSSGGYTSTFLSSGGYTNTFLSAGGYTLHKATFHGSHKLYSDLYSTVTSQLHLYRGKSSPRRNPSETK